MGLRLWTGRSGSGKSFSLYSKIIEEAEKNPAMNYIIIVPEQFTLQTQKDILRLSPKHGILNIDILSFKRLAYRVFGEVGFKSAQGVLIDDMGKNLILRRLLAQYSDELPILGANAAKLGYVTEIKSAISEFMQYGIGGAEIEKLIKRAEKRPLLASKLKELHTLYNAFENFIKERLITAEELLIKVSACIPESEMLKSSVISFDGFTGFTPVQEKVIRALLEHCPEVNVTVLIDNNSINGKENLEQHELFYLSKKMGNSLKKLAKDADALILPDFSIDQDVPARFLRANAADACEMAPAQETEAFDASTEKVKNPKLIHLERFLFRDECPPYKGKDSDDIRLYSGLNRSDEITKTAILINELVRKNNYAYHEIAVITGDIDSYMNVCGRIFTQYDIPFFIDKSIPILLNPFTEYLKAILSVVSDNYSYPSIIRYLRSYMTDLPMERIDRLDNYIISQGIRGRKRWHERFIKRSGSISEEELSRLEADRKEIIEPFREFEKALTGKDDNDRGFSAGTKFPAGRITRALYDFIVKNDSAGKLTRLSKKLSEEGNEIKAKELSQIYGRVMELLDQMTELLGDEETDIREYSGLLDAGFSEIRIGVVPKTHDYVQIGDITRSRLKNIKALFVVGANDGIIPGTGTKGGLISDIDREFLSENEDGISMAPSLRQQAYTQRLYLYMMLTKPSERLYISFSRISESGGSVKPSYLIKIICDMFPKLRFDLKGQDLEDRIVNEKTAYRALCSEIREFCQRFGKDPGKNRKSFEIKYLKLFNIYKLNNYNDMALKHLLDAAFSKGPNRFESKINRAIAGAIYGTGISCGITRLEKYAECAYSHFLIYGLKLKEREEFVFDARNLGSLFHDALMYYGRLLREKNLNWNDVTQEMRYEIIDEAVERAVGSGKYGSLYADHRSAYMKERIRRFARRSVDTLSVHLKKGRFEPKYFELPFGNDAGSISMEYKLTEAEKLNLTGRIDRIDVCEDGENVYIKVIDYKSGSKSFDLSSVYDGTDIQLPVYLYAASEYCSGKDGENKKKNIIPAGFFYYRIDDPVVDYDGTESDELDGLINKELRMSGIVNSDEEIYKLIDSELNADSHSNSDIIPVRLTKNEAFYADSAVVSTQDFHTISGFVNLKIAEMGREILDGNIEIRPDRGEDSVCAYCKFGNICARSVREGDAKEKPKAGREELLAKMREKISLSGGSQDG
ncbi:MAG: PD-(D/E)XK nuclease family protein [Lachnospiraceae bacterium]|nr:PD-(D/E)XK nuclease family protein [Lachnospiraceae bacterium]